MVGIEERLYVSLGKIFDGETTINDIKLCLSNVIKIEPLLKKMILLIDEDEYDKIVQENLGLAHVITQLGLNPDNKKLDRKPEDYLGDGNYMEHIARSYALRNSESHTYVGWTRREIYTNLDSVLITCLRAVEINKKALLSNLKKKSINNELNIENYLNEITQQLKKRMSRFIHIRGEENFSVLGSYVIEYQDDTSDSRRRKGTVEYLRDNSILERRMMIWGEAGMGKTTTLEYLTYMDAKKRLKDSNYNILVLVLLGVMTKATYTIKQYICDKLDIGVDICESLLEEGKINLFLDGLNEIPADAGGNLKTLRMREIKQLLRDYPKTFIIITNRPQDTTHLKEKEHLEGGRIEGENIKAKLQTGEFGLDMAEYMGEYKIIRRMDGGGNANVFVAEHARGEEVAIKILREESGNGKKAVKRNRKKRIRFKIETEMVVGIQDEIKGVIPIFSYGLPDEKTKKYWYATGCGDSL